MNVKIHSWDNHNNRIVVDDKTSPVTITVCDYKTGEKRQIHAEMVEARIAEVPDGYHKYSLRESDEGSWPATIENEVIVNHYGDILVKEPLEFSEYMPIEYFSID